MKEVKISLLINSIYYFLHWVFLINDGNQFRLVVILRKEIILDSTYDNPRGARIAFSRYFEKRHYKDEDIENHWSLFYAPDKEWLDEKLNFKPSESLYTGNI